MLININNKYAFSKIIGFRTDKHHHIARKDRFSPIHSTWWKFNLDSLKVAVTKNHFKIQKQKLAKRQLPETTVIVPPSTMLNTCAILTTLIIVSIKCGKSIIFVGAQKVFCIS